LRQLQGEVGGKGLRIGVVVSRFNEKLTTRLLEGALRALSEAGVDDDDVTVISVPGAFEIPGTAKKLALGGTVDGIACLGAVVRGKTEHFTYVCKAAQEGVLAATLETGIPMAFGVLTTEDYEQALSRTGGDRGDKGYETACDAIEMANTYRQLR
jgi:6,7-dimethyl-8-ribityllumazine synthase